MSETLFISDLHLDAGRPEIIALAAHLLGGRALDCDALYILGDLFEFWIGDDQPTPGMEPLLDALTLLKKREVPVFFIAGNRDFLVGDEFANRYGLTLLPDSAVIDLYGCKTLLLHGDTLCTDDIKYQQLRSMLRNPEWQRQFLALPLQERIEKALALRKQSAEETGEKDEMIMDVNQSAVVEAMQENGVTRLIHGHTHRPAIHELHLDGVPTQRIVLGDWYQEGSILSCNSDDCELEVLSLNNDI